MKRAKTIIQLFLLLTLFALAACEFSGPDLSQQERKPVGFGIYTEQFQTRAAQEVKAIADGGSMGIYAYLHDNGTWTDAATPNFMWNQQATYNAESDAFDYAPLKYWPNEENDKVSFIAYYPYTNPDLTDDADHPVLPDSKETTGLTPQLANSGTGLPTFSFTVNDDADSQVDLLVSNLIVNLPHSRDTQNDPGTAFNDLSIYDKVKFLFQHALAKVEFRIVADAEIRKDIVAFNLEDLSVTNINKTGTLTPAYNGGTGETSFAWSSQTTTHNYAFKTYEAQLLMPQTLSDDALLTFSYTIKFKSDGTSYTYDAGGNLVTGQDYTYRNSAELQLNSLKIVGTNTALTTWEANHSYVYTIRLRANSIEFTGQVVEWGETIPIEDIIVEEPS